MAEFLTTDGISSEITNIIRNAGSQVTLITPYLKLSDILFERLKDADRRGKKINLVYGKDELKPDEKSKLKQLANLSLYFSKELHAKCYYNEESMVIASMNLHEYSQQHNREMGILLSLKDDHDVFVFNEARTEAESIVSNADKYSLIRSILSKTVKEVKSRVDAAVKDEPKRLKSRSYSSKPRTKQPGHCIRCGKSIPLALGKPYCPDCFVAWSEWENPNYKEQYCHNCGRPAPTTMLKPQCSSCFRKFYS